MKKWLVIVTGLLFFTACTSETNKKIVHKEISKTIDPCSKVEANRMLTMELEGMTCVMGCGASIRKELFATEAICKVEFDFEEDRKSNTAKIAFDKDKITVDEIVKIITVMNDKQFTVKKTSSEDYSCPTSAKSDCTSKEHCASGTKCDGETKEECKIKSSQSRIELPNFIGILSRFLTH